jgi:YfiR/HmsC-like
VCRRAVGLIAAALIPLLAPAQPIAAGGDVAPDVAVKAAFLYNFAKFAEWPGLAAGAPIVICVIGDDRLAAAMVETVHGQLLSGHALKVAQPRETAQWRGCHLLFIADAEVRHAAADLEALKSLPVLTISDSKDFAQATGITELFIEAGRMRFAINLDTADASGLHLSSRLLGLAKIVRKGHGQ